MSNVRLQVTCDSKMLAHVLNNDGDYRVLKRVRELRRFANRYDRAVQTGCAVAVRTTGPNRQEHNILELSLQQFGLNATGQIVETGSMHSWLEHPMDIHGPMPSRFSGGYGPDLFKGRSIADGVATSLIRSADFIIAHRAASVRPFVERRLPLCAGQPWVCVVRDIDWEAEGWADSSLASLLIRHGIFHGGQRASADVIGLVNLLNQSMGNGNAVAAQAVANAKKDSWVVEISDPASSAHQVLRGKGYLLNQDNGVWATAVKTECLAGELQWASVMACYGRAQPKFRRMTWCERYA